VVAWKGEAYCILHPYAADVFSRPDGVGVEFRHTMEALFNGLLDAGLTLQRMHEAPCADRLDDRDTPPGSWHHERSHVAGEFVIIAENRRSRSSESDVT
jgi:hypothetical protein